MSALIGSVILDTVSVQKNKVSALCYVILGLPSVCTHGSQMFPSHVNTAMESNQVTVGDFSAPPVSEIRLWTLSRVVFIFSLLMGFPAGSAQMERRGPASRDCLVLETLSMTQTPGRVAAVKSLQTRGSRLWLRHRGRKLPPPK